jgi:hypothetical protein
MPDALREILARFECELVADGHPVAAAKQMALRLANHSGWFRTRTGWKKLAKDVSDKVNVRRGEKQPDGTYYVPDVDCFYPNAVKPAPELQDDGTITLTGTKQYKPDDVRAIIENTNRSIEAGGQRPALTRGHPSKEQKALGITPHSFGEAIKWRESPRGRGWARCDLASIDPELYEDWRKRRYTGLSAAIAQDAGGLNRRFGHVAALGAESQALSALPMTEVFSVPDQVCFSADPAAFCGPGKIKTLKGAKMKKMDPKHAGALKDCYRAFATALSSYEAGEPEAEAKIMEAGKALKAKHTEFAVEMPGEEMPAMPATPATEVPPPLATQQQPAEETPGEYQVETVCEFSTDPDAAFAASQRNFQKLMQHTHLMGKRMTSLDSQNKLLKAKMSLDQFSTDLKAIAEEGHEFAAQPLLEMFQASGGDLETGNRLKAIAKSAPKKAPTPASQGTIFGVNGRQTEDFSASTLEAEAAELTAEFGSDFNAAFGMLGAKCHPSVVGR